MTNKNVSTSLIINTIAFLEVHRTLWHKWGRSDFLRRIRHQLQEERPVMDGEPMPLPPWQSSKRTLNLELKMQITFSPWTFWTFWISNFESPFPIHEVSVWEVFLVFLKCLLNWKSHLSLLDFLLLRIVMYSFSWCLRIVKFWIIVTYDCPVNRHVIFWLPHSANFALNKTYLLRVTHDSLVYILDINLLSALLNLFVSRPIH